MFLLCCMGAEKNIANWSVSLAFAGIGLLLLYFLRSVTTCSHSRTYIISPAKHRESSWLILTFWAIDSMPVWWSRQYVATSDCLTSALHLRAVSSSTARSWQHILCVCIMLEENHNALVLCKSRRRAFKRNPFPLPVKRHLRTNHRSIKQKEKTLSITSIIMPIL